MAILCLATSIADLERRMGQMVVAAKRDKGQVLARDLKAPGAMTVLLKDALMPNLVQTLENNPAFVHGGPFANIAHGCNSVMATRTGLKLADYVVTEAGFGADLGAEKFFDIKCRKAGLTPAATVIVATVRALKMHGGAAKEELKKENFEALRKGLANLGRHIENVKKFGVPIAVALNHFSTDTDAEIDVVKAYCKGHGVEAFKCTHWAEGGKGVEVLARHVAELADKGSSQFKPIYNEELPLWDKIKTIAREIYRADDIVADKSVRDQLRGFEAQGYGRFPICMAKTQYSFSTDPTLKGAPTNHVVPIREVRLSAGAEFIVVICGDVMTMPGLPKVPSAEVIGLDAKGQIAGLF
jgi:formate--tetrahydrofolate ligase